MIDQAAIAYADMMAMLAQIRRGEMPTDGHIDRLLVKAEAARRADDDAED